MNVVVKIGTSSITDERGEIDHRAIEKLATEVTAVRGQGHRVVVVTSGAIAAGLPALGLSGARPVDVATLQAVSAVGQSRLMAAYDTAMAGHGLVTGQVLLAPFDYLWVKGVGHPLLPTQVVAVAAKGRDLGLTDESFTSLKKLQENWHQAPGRIRFGPVHVSPGELIRAAARDLPRAAAQRAASRLRSSR